MTSYTYIYSYNYCLGMLIHQKLKSALKIGSLIEEHEIECHPEKVSNAVLNENVDVHLVCQYLRDNAWKLIEDVVERKKDCDVWLCKICHHDLHGSK